MGSLIKSITVCLSTLLNKSAREDTVKYFSRMSRKLAHSSLISARPRAALQVHVKVTVKVKVKVKVKEALKPNSITLADSELVRNWFEAGSN